MGLQVSFQSSMFAYMYLRKTISIYIQLTRQVNVCFPLEIVFFCSGSITTFSALKVRLVHARSKDAGSALQSTHQ